jgi:hypothetical protein
MSFACLCTKTFVETYTLIPICHSSKHGSRASFRGGNVFGASRSAVKCCMTTDFTTCNFLSVIFVCFEVLLRRLASRQLTAEASDSNPHTVWDLWWTKWQWDKILCKYSGFLSVVIASVLRIYLSFGGGHWAHCRPQFQWSTVAPPHK